MRQFNSWKIISPRRLKPNVLSPRGSVSKEIQQNAQEQVEDARLQLDIASKALGDFDVDALQASKENLQSFGSSQPGTKSKERPLRESVSGRRIGY